MTSDELKEKYHILQKIKENFFFILADKVSDE